MILLLDNYDSFTYNLVHLFHALQTPVEVHRNREISAAEALERQPQAIVLSPGPGRPEQAGIMLELIRLAADQEIPILGVCLGHQAIGQAFGARVVHAARVVHGKTSSVSHDGRGLFARGGGPFQAMRYHSLALERESLPPELEITATADDGEIMGVRHRQLLIEGIQYHPESIMTPSGKAQLANFMAMVAARRPQPA